MVQLESSITWFQNSDAIDHNSNLIHRGLVVPKKHGYKQDYLT